MAERRVERLARARRAARTVGLGQTRRAEHRKVARREARARTRLQLLTAGRLVLSSGGGGGAALAGGGGAPGLERGRLALLLRRELVQHQVVAVKVALVAAVATRRGHATRLEPEGRELDAAQRAARVGLDAPAARVAARVEARAAPRVAERVERELAVVEPAAQQQPERVGLLVAVRGRRAPHQVQQRVLRDLRLRGARAAAQHDRLRARADERAASRRGAVAPQHGAPGALGQHVHVRLDGLVVDGGRAAHLGRAP